MYMKRFWQSNNKILKFVLFSYIVWQLAILIIGLVIPLMKIPRRSGYNYIEVKALNPFFLWDRANFDGIHYLDIVGKGYDKYQQAFFPMYPNVIKWLNPIVGGRSLLSGLLISNLSLLFLLFIFFKLISLDFDELTAKKSLIFLLVFPTSFFFGMVYTESLFLLFVLTSFYFARRNRWLAAGILGALAANTRLVGIFVFPALLFEWWEQRKISNFKFSLLQASKQIPGLLAIFLVPLGLLFYMRFLKINFNDPLLSFHSQPFFGADRSGGKIILLYQVFWRYFKMILGTRPDPLYVAVWLELSACILFIILLILALKKKIRASYLIFSVLSLLVPSLSGTFSSYPRYVLVLFPCFIFLGTIESRLLRGTLTVAFLILAFISMTLFFRGYWIS